MYETNVVSNICNAGVCHVFIRKNNCVAYFICIDCVACVLRTKYCNCYVRIDVYRRHFIFIFMRSYLVYL